jgi:hypothetical protein
MKQIILIFTLIVVSIIACKQHTQKPISEKYKSRVFQTELNQFGYDIYQDSTLMIHQPTIPGVQGNKAFSRREEAQRVADLMIYKLNLGITPPAISIKELDSLNIKGM